MVAWENAGDGLRVLIEYKDVHAAPPQFSPGAPQFAPHASNALPFTNLSQQCAIDP